MSKGLQMQEKEEKIIDGREKDKVNKQNDQEKIIDGREKDIVYFVDNYLKMPNDRTYKQLMVLLEADYMKISAKRFRDKS